MSALSGKYHILIDGVGYNIFRNRGGTSYYQRKKAPSFVNKFGGGDSSYRDSTFWQYFAQINWRNGCKQEKFDDGGKFWKSQDVDINELGKVKLAKALVSAGQVEAGAKVTCMTSWRASQSWWSGSYGYRQQLTVTAPAGKQVPAGYPIKITVNTDTLQTAGKVRSDRKDWRVVYFNGTSYEDLVRDYVSASVTYFGAKVAISAGQSDSNYYIYYGYSSESTTKQASTIAEYNEIYTPEDEDEYVKALFHFYEGTGATLADSSGNSNNGTITGATWSTDSYYGRSLDFDASSERVVCGSTDLNVGSFTFQTWIKYGGAGRIAGQLNGGPGNKWVLTVNSSRQLSLSVTNSYGVSVTSDGSIGNATWAHIAVTFDGATTVKFYINGALDSTKTLSETGIKSATTALTLGGVESTACFTGKLHSARMDNVARTSFPHVLGTEPTTAYASEITTQPPASSFTLYAGTDTGKVYSWDGATTWTEVFDCRKLDNHEAGGDAAVDVGDYNGTDSKQAQGFKLTADEVKSKVGGMRIKIKNLSCPSDITARIETDNAGAPSGTLADAKATGTIPMASIPSADYGWVTLNFAESFTLTAATLYWLVLSVPDQANNLRYLWLVDGSSPGYTDGAMSSYYSGSWHAVAGSDAYFNVLSGSTSVNCMITSSIGGTQKLLIGTGKIDSQANGDARLYSFDGSTWLLEEVIDDTTCSQITAMTEFSGKIYFGVGPQAKVYETSDLADFTLSKDIDSPQKPGYVYSLTEYNQNLYAMGGSPEFMYDKYYDGFCWSYDGTTWQSIYPFDHTTIKSSSFYDSFLFMGTYHGHIYVYNLSTLDPLFNLKEDYDWRNQISCMKYFDDKLYIGLYPQDESGETNVGVLVFDRHGISMKHTISGISGVTCLEQVNNNLMVGTGNNGYVYKLSETAYVEQGYLQSSYFDANLPSIDKLYSQIDLAFKPLPSGTNIKIYFKYKEDDSWTLLGTCDTDDSTEDSLPFPSASYSKKISLKYEFNTNDTAQTPELNELILKYTLMPAIKWIWNVRILCKNNAILLDKTTDTRSAADIRSSLETELDTKELHTLTDLDGTTYTVLFNDLDTNSWVINQDDGSEVTIPISLIEA
jgi:hypothetical protein